MTELGLVLACSGCCCGHPDRGGAMAPPRVLKSTARRVYRASGLADRVRLSFTDCLGPCSEANVVALHMHGRLRWFRRMNSPDILATLLGYARAALDGRAPDLPAELAGRSFSWAGSGAGPTPPICDPPSG